MARTVCVCVCVVFDYAITTHTRSEGGRGGGTGFGYLKSHSSCSQRIFRCWPNFLFMLFSFISNAALFFFLLLLFFFSSSSCTLKFICKLCSYFIGICFVLFWFLCLVMWVQFWVSFIGLVWGKEEGGRERGGRGNCRDCVIVDQPLNMLIVCSCLLFSPFPLATTLLCCST